MSSYTAAAARAAQTSSSAVNTDPASDQAMLNNNQYLGRTASLPRPEATDRAYQWSRGADDFKRDIERYDFAVEWQRQNDELKTKRAAEFSQQREKSQQDRRNEADARYVDSLRRRYFDSDPGANEADFQRDLGEIRRQSRIQAAIAEPAGTSRGRM